MQKENKQKVQRKRDNSIRELYGNTDVRTQEYMID